MEEFLLVTTYDGKVQQKMKTILEELCGGLNGYDYTDYAKKSLIRNKSQEKYLSEVAKLALNSWL